jgi:hypothetical protein
MLPAILLAAPVDPNLAQQVAENFINAPETEANGVVHKAPRKQKRMARALKQITNDQQFYVFNSEDGDGFVIVSADDVAHPILGYSKTEIIDINNLPENFKWWLNEYSREIRWAQDNNLMQTKEIAIEWQRVLMNQVKASTPIVEPLIKTEWGQDAPFNNKCPIYDGQHRALTGCVATAVAQIMNYWQHPIKGTGSHSYISDTRNFELSADFENTVYDWKNMADTYKESRTTVQKNAVATLMSDVGIAFDMDYAGGSSGQSGSNNSKALKALPSYFGYDSSIMILEKDNHTSISWIGVLGNQLDNGKPILYEGYGESSGHSFICDGYDNNMLFHFNWGQNGQYNNCYLNTDALIFDNHDYSCNQYVIINIIPAQSSKPIYNLQLANDLKFYKGNEYQFIDPLTTNINPFDSLYLVVDLINSFCESDFKGTLYAALFTNNQYFFVDSIKNINLPITSTSSYNVCRFIFEHIGNTYIEDGVYSIRICYKPNGEKSTSLVGSDYFANSLFFTTEYTFTAQNGNYVIVANRDKDGDRNWYYMTSDLGTASTKRFQAVNTGTESIEAINFSDLEDKYVWTLEKSGIEWKLKNGTKYVSWTSGNSATLASAARNLTLDAENNQVQVHFNDGTSERYLSLNAAANNNYFAFYGNQNQVTKLFFIPYKESETPITPTECKTVPYTETFASSQGDFTIENPELPSGFTSIWNWNSQYGMVTNSTKNNTKYKSEAWLLSPCIELPENDKCVLTFSHAAKFFSSTEQMTLYLTTDYIKDAPGESEWHQLTIPNYPTGANWDWFESGEIDLSAYQGKEVVIAFRYVSDTNYAPQWEIKNFTVKQATTTAVSNTKAEESSATKILRNGQIFILRGDKTYTLQGQEVK